MIDRNVRHRFFQVLRLLFEETDEEHALSVAQIIERLTIRFGTTYKLERRAIYKDLETLLECGVPIETLTGRSNQKFYRWVNKPFDRHELHLLVHAVHSARFISHQDTEEVTNKIRVLAGKWDVGRQVERHHLQERVKTVFGSLREIMRAVDRAVSQSRKLHFQYGKWNAQKCFVLRNEGKEYQISPYALVWVNDFAYVVGRPEGEDGFKHYRLDRMREARIGTSFRAKEFNQAAYVKQAFQMYGGSVHTVWLRIEEDLINVIYDRLGLDVHLTAVTTAVHVATTDNDRMTRVEDIRVAFADELAPTSEDVQRAILALNDDQTHEEHVQDIRTYDVSFEGAVSDGLVRWVLSLGPQAEVIEPLELRERVLAMVHDLTHTYTRSTGAGIK